jgi:hypothetical protein
MGFGLIIGYTERYNSSRICTLYKSLYCSTHKLFCLFTSHCLITASNNVDSSVSVLYSYWLMTVTQLSSSSSFSQQSVDQFVWVSGLPLGPLTRFYLALLSSSDNYLILLSKAPSLTRKRVCSLQCNHSLVPITILYRLI